MYLCVEYLIYNEWYLAAEFSDMENCLGTPLALLALPLFLLQDSLVLAPELLDILIDNQMTKALLKLWTTVSASFILKNN